MPGQGRLGDAAFCPADAHGCPACAHPVTGPAIAGSPDVIVNHLPALRDGDPGVHAACCGPNTWTANGGAAWVIINHRRAFRLSDGTAHCGGSGQLVAASADVIVGDDGGGGGVVFPQRFDEQFILKDRKSGKPLANVRYRITLADGETIEGRSGSGGETSLVASETADRISITILPRGRR